MGLENSRHLAIFNCGDDGVGRRVSAIGKISARVRRKSSPSDLLTIATVLIRALSKSILSDEERSAVVAILQKEAPSFVDDGQKSNELATLFALGCAEAINAGPQVASADAMRTLAGAVYSGLEYLSPLDDPAREALRSDIMILCRSRLKPNQARRRNPVPADVTGANSAEAINVLASNAELDREEIDLLWWVINDWSELAQQRVSGLAPEVAAVVSTIETSALLAGPAARSHRDIAMRHVADLGEVREPAAFAAAAAPTRDWVRHALAGGMASIEQFQLILPALSLVTLPDAKADQPQALAAAGHAASLADWVRRLVDEIGLVSRLGHSININPPA